MRMQGLVMLLASPKLLLVLLAVWIFAVGFLRGGFSIPWVDDPPQSYENDAFNSAKRMAVRVVAVSNDGAFLDVGQGDGDFVRRDALTGRKLHDLDVPRGRLPWVKFKGCQETWVGLNQKLQLEFVRDGARQWHGLLPGQEPTERLVECGLSLPRGLIIAVSATGFLWVMDLEEKQVVPRGRYAVGEPLADAVLSPTGELLILVTDGWKFLIWDIAQGKVVTRLDTDGTLARYASWSGDGRRIVTFGHDPQLKVWDIPAGQSVRRLNLESRVVESAALSFDGHLVAAGEEDVIRLWDLETGAELQELDGHLGILTTLHFSDQDRTLFSGDIAGGLRRWSLTDYREIWAVP